MRIDPTSMEYQEIVQEIAVEFCEGLNAEEAEILGRMLAQIGKQMILQSYHMTMKQ